MEIKPGTKISKPVITQEECDAYSAVVDAITAHNAAASVGEALWSMDDQPDAYVVVEAGTQPDPADAPKPTLHWRSGLLRWRAPRQMPMR